MLNPHQQKNQKFPVLFFWGGGGFNKAIKTLLHSGSWILAHGSSSAENNPTIQQLKEKQKT